jgi:NAD(P)-dependent dehydrogenase (short-subunit alcohol dehydrogenase family)
MRAVITGTSSGLGQSLVKKLRESGYETIGISKSPSPETDYICNLQLSDNIRGVFNDLIPRINTVDYLILNAGVLGKIDKANEINEKDLFNVFQVNLFSNKLILDLLINSPVDIKNVILISSGASLKAYDGWISYCLTKSALNQLARCYALENDNIKFISLAPGIIQTKMQDEIIINSEDRFTSISKFKGLYGKNPTPDFIANKIIKNLENFRNLESGQYFDLREIND